MIGWTLSIGIFTVGGCLSLYLGLRAVNDYLDGYDYDGELLLTPEMVVGVSCNSSVTCYPQIESHRRGRKVMWPWSKISTLEADLAEALAANRQFVESNHVFNSQNRTLSNDMKALRDANWSLTIENKRLISLMERAVFRCPDTGRLLPNGRQY